MPHNRTLIALIALALSVASLAGVCGEPTPAATPVANTATAPAPTGTATPVTATVLMASDTPVAPSPAEAASATPIPTVEEEPTSVPNRRHQLPTASSQAQAMALGGTVYVDGQPAHGRVAAFIAGRRCGEGQSITFPDSEAPEFAVIIKSDADQSGCGIPGAEITFTVNDLAVNETLVWQPGYLLDPVALSAGPAIAIYAGSMSLRPGDVPSPKLVPYIDGVVCGEGAVPYLSLQDHARWIYHVVVDPDGLRAGCGRDGAFVSLRLQIEGQPDIDIATVPWQPLPAVQVANVDLRSQPLGAPSTTVAP